MKNLLAFLIVLVVLSGCMPINLYEKQIQIPTQKWYYSYVPKFTFHIEDTVTSYQMYIVIRHTDQYEYNNIWIKLGTQYEEDSINYQRMNLRLAAPGMGWEGRGMGDIFEVRKMITPGAVTFGQAGDYTFSMEQVMRENPLRHILSVGMRIEKVSQ